MPSARFGRRGVLKSAGAFLAAAAASARFEPLALAQASPSRPIVLSDANAVVETASGRVRGYTEQGIHTFKGIPYGAPPVGPLRFMPPAKPRPWVNVRNSMQYGPACPQPGGRVDDLNQFFFEFDRGYQDEDCLCLNVWTPGLNDNRKRPVMFWLHGGGFGTGSAFELPSYDGRNLARRGDVVVVSINHRLNAFGYLHLAELGDRFADSVNAGMLDIVSALDWVRDNIVGFGGDPSNVTVFGQSGGGAKVQFLMAMPSAKGLFHKAVIQSATPMTRNVRSLAFSTRHTASMLSRLGLSTVEQLQALPPAALRDAYILAGFQVEFELDARARWDRLTEDDIRSIGFDAAQPARSTGRLKERLQARYAFDEQRADLELARFANRAFFDNMGPIADGRAIVQAPFFRSAPELSAAVPVLVGHTLNEGGGPNFFNTMREQWTDADLRLELSRRPNPVPDGVIDGLRQAYPRAKPVELYAHTVNQGGLAYRVDAVSLAAHKMVQNAAPAYLYVFAWKTRVLEGRPRAFHRSELPFVFDNTDRCAHQTGGTREARAMAAKVADAWIAFARTGSPRHSGLPEWPVFSSDRVPTMMFDDDCEVRYDHDRAARLAWESPRPSA